MLSAIFEFLFKYPKLVFEQAYAQGDFAFGATRFMSLVALAAGAAALYMLLTYRRLAAVRGRDRGVLLAVRVALVLIVLFALMQPMLLLKVAVPQENFVGILLDDSRSMQVADYNNG